MNFDKLHGNTTRVGEPVSDAVTALWKGHGRRLHLPQLPEATIDELFAHALAGQVRFPLPMVGVDTPVSDVMPVLG